MTDSIRSSEVFDTIYRIKLSKRFRPEEFEEDNPETWPRTLEEGRVRDINRPFVACELGDEMLKLGFKGPDRRVNRRARFYFTERGWDEFGRKVFAIAVKKGLNPKVIRLKNPKRSDVVYSDAYQVAVLPSSE